MSDIHSGPSNGLAPRFAQIDVNPTTTGFAAPPGSIVLYAGLYYSKYGTGNTAWEVAPFGDTGSIASGSSITGITGISTLFLNEAGTVNPRVTGLARAIGSTYLQNTAGVVSGHWYKYGTGDTEWYRMDAEVDPQHFRRIATELLATSNLQWYWADVPEISGGWSGNATGTSSVSSFLDYAPELTCGAAANSKNTVWPVAPSATIANGNVSLGGTGSNFYMVARFAASTAIDAQTKIMAGLISSTSLTKFLAVGVNGAIGTTNYCVSVDGGGSIDTGVAINLLWHIFEVYRTGSLTFVRVDGGSWVSGNVFATACTAGSEALRTAFYIQNGTTATARKLAMNFYGLAYQRAA